MASALSQRSFRPVTNPTDTLELTLDALVRRLEPASHHTRTDGIRTVLLAGPMGHIGRDLYLTLRVEALSDEAKAAARELLDAGVIAADVDDHLYVRRLPNAEIETRLFRQMLGLLHRLDKRAH